MHVNKTPAPQQTQIKQQAAAQLNAALKTAAQKPVMQPSANTPAARTAASLIAASGLPADKLSSSIISFARFFSLPIKPELMAEIRKQIVQQAAFQQAASQQTETQPRIALSLAATAAESKGVDLQQKTLELYCEAVDPDRRKKDSDGQSRDKKEKEQQKFEAINASAVKKAALESAENDPVLNILNRLPGKNGQRWIVIPFDFFQNESEYRVSMRILLEGQKSQSRAVCMAVDILKMGDAPNRYTFVCESANDKTSKLSAYFKNELPQKVCASIQNELAKLLEISADKVFVKTLEEPFPCESGYEGELFQSIDEAV